jgi:hypothetical protein
MGKDLLDRLCRVFEVDEDAFTFHAVAEKSEINSEMPQVMRMILEEVEILPEYEQLRILADLKEKRAKRLDERKG